VKSVQKIPQIFYSTLRIGSCWKGALLKAEAFLWSIALAGSLYGMPFSQDLDRASTFGGSRGTKLIYSLSQEEEQELKLLCHYLFAQNELGYTLFGDKPMSFCFLPTGVPRIAVRDCFFKIYIQGQHSFIKGVAAWNKLRKESNYSLITYEDNNNYPLVAFFVNKKAFTEVFNKNIDVFKKNYGSKVTVEFFLAELESKKIPLDKLFNQHLFLGILLGYGRHNAELFQRRNILHSPEAEVPFLPDQKPKKGFSSIEGELKYLDQHLQPITLEDSLLLLVTPVNFVADPDHPETVLLKQKYDSIHKELTIIFKRDDWLDTLFSQIYSD